MKVLVGILLLALAIFTSPATAAPVLVGTNVNLTEPYIFSFDGVDFTFGTNVTEQNSANGAVQAFRFLGISVRPSASFINRSTVNYGPTGTQFASFLTPTLDPSATGESFIGLRAGTNPNAFFGFTYLTGTTLAGTGTRRWRTPRLRPRRRWLRFQRRRRGR